MSLKERKHSAYIKVLKIIIHLIREHFCCVKISTSLFEQIFNVFLAQGSRLIVKHSCCQLLAQIDNLTQNKQRDKMDKSQNENQLAALEMYN